ncbi:hypothetical protein [Agromyces sp. GXQ0307]|uniref:hypothetical protein n=1 Tax=Agromyces sp. GXQ0307 TaxID=3377835 RepID=UPI00383BEEF5
MRRVAIAAASMFTGLMLAMTAAVAPATAAKPVRGGATAGSYSCGYFDGLSVTSPKVVVDSVALKAGEVIGATVSPARVGDDIFLTSSIGLNITFSGGPATEGFMFTAPADAIYRLSFSLAVPDGSTVPDGLTWSFTCSTGGGGGQTAPTTADTDKDGVADAADICPSTSIPESVHRTAGKYYAAAGGRFIDGAGVDSRISVIDTAGCNAAQIASKLKLSKKASRGGITISQLTNWANAH